MHEASSDAVFLNAPDSRLYNADLAPVTTFATKGRAGSIAAFSISKWRISTRTADISPGAS